MATVVGAKFCVVVVAVGAEYGCEPARDREALFGGLGVGVAGVQDRQQQRAGANEGDQGGVVAGDDGVVAAGCLGQDMAGECFFAGIEQGAGHA
jgi:hypothetical protein